MRQIPAIKYLFILNILSVSITSAETIILVGDPQIFQEIISGAHTGRQILIYPKKNRFPQQYTPETGAFSNIESQRVNLKLEGQYKYVGETKLGKPHGTGILTGYSQSYQGDWIDGKPHGTGVFKQSTGYEYSGSWVNGIRSGLGKLTYKTEIKFDEQTRKMTGRSFMPVRIIYEGNFLEDKAHGEGICHVNTKKQRCKFKNGLLATELSVDSKYTIKAYTK